MVLQKMRSVLTADKMIQYFILFVTATGPSGFFSEVIKWCNVENATSFAPSSSELIFGLNNERKNQSSLAIVKKLDFTLLFAKYYLYINKLAPKDLSLDQFKAKVSWRYDFEKPPSSIS